MPILTDMSAQFRAQIQPNIQPNATTEDYQRLINATFVMEKGYWDLIVAKLDSLLNYITNGSWSLSEKTVLINEIDNFRGTLLGKLDGFSVNELNNYEGIACTIDREVFRFVMKNISTKPLSSDVTLGLKTNQGGLPAIQLNSASGLLAEFPGDTVGDLQFQNYDPNKAKYIPQKLSQLLCTLMSLCEQSDLWNRLYNSAYTDLRNNADDATVCSLATLADKYDSDNLFNFKIMFALSELRCYIWAGDAIITPVDPDESIPCPSFDEKMNLWVSIQSWLATTTLSPNVLFKVPKSVKNDIYTFLYTMNFKTLVSVSENYH